MEPRQSERAFEHHLVGESDVQHRLERIPVKRSLKVLHCCQFLTLIASDPAQEEVAGVMPHASSGEVFQQADRFGLATLRQCGLRRPENHCVLIARWTPFEWMLVGISDVEPRMAAAAGHPD